MSDPVTIARKHLEHLRKEIARIEQWLHEADRFAELENSYPTAKATLAPITASRGSKKRGPLSSSAGGSMQVRAAVIEILLERGAASTSSLMDMLSSRGIHIRSESDKPPKTVLSNMLSRDRKYFENDKVARVWKLSKAAPTIEKPS